MKKHILIIFMLVLALALASCKESPTYLYDVPKGDIIEVGFDASKTEYLLIDSGDSFSVENGSKTIVEGAFSNWSLAEMEYYLTTNEARITDRSDTELVWDDLSTLGVEYNTVRQLSDKTILIMTAKGDEDTVNDVYDRLYFRIADPADLEAQDDDTASGDDVDAKGLIRQQAASGTGSDGLASDGLTSVFKLGKFSLNVPGGSAAKKVSSYEYVINADKSVIELELAPVGKNMTDGAMTIKGYVNNLGGDINENSEIRINGFLVGVATFSVNGQPERAYIFTIDKKAYALRSNDVELLDSVMATLKFS